jgi:aspartate racemase
MPASPLVGILGGMGPAATVDFYEKLVRATPAREDQDHLRVVIWADPSVPSRQRAVLSGGEDPTPWLVAGVEHLLRCGAQILVAPCNTVHAYLPAVVNGRDVEFISIIDVAIDAVQQVDRSGPVGVLATDAALKAGLYQTALREACRQPVLPSSPSQAALMRVVQTVKAGGAGEHEQQVLRTVVTELQDVGASTAIAGCTEISVLLNELDTELHVIDPSNALALATIQRARSAHP